MRPTLPATILLSVMLAACASNKAVPQPTSIAQSGPLKVHPGLLGQPVPAELQQEALASAAPAAAPAPESEPAIKIDATGLRTQRSVYFDLNSADIKADFDPALSAHGRYLTEHPEARIRIEGNADERGTAGYNNRLGLKRAENVRQALIAHGASTKQLSIKSLGKTKPKKTGHDEESWAENRRADVVYEKEK